MSFVHIILEIRNLMYYSPLKKPILFWQAVMQELLQMKNDLSIENALTISNRFINTNWRDGPIGCE